MKRSDLNKFIKENIIETLSEGASSEEKRIALRAVKSIAKYRNVSEDEAKRDLINAIKELGSIKEELPSKEEVEDTTAAVKVLKKELDSLEEGAIDPAEYGDIGSAYLKGFNKPHSLDLDQLETLGRKIVKQLYKGDFDKAKAKFIKEEDFKNPILDK